MNTGLSTNRPSDVDATNKVRARYGIRLIKPDWQFYRREFGAEDWKDRQGHGCKRVQRDEDSRRIVWEEDYYATGASFVTVNGVRAWEQLTIHFDYGEQKFYIGYIGVDATVKAVEKSLNLKDKGYAGKSNTDTLKVADTILKKWGKARL